MHGLSIPLGTLGFHIPRTLSQALSTENNSNSTFHVQNPTHTSTSHLRFRPSSEAGQNGIPVPNGVYRIGRSLIPRSKSDDASRTESRNISKQGTSRTASPAGKKDMEMAAGNSSNEPTPDDGDLPLPPLDGAAKTTGRVAGPAGRSIRFPDETHNKIGSAERSI